MPKADFVCAPTLRVRWAEVDMQKIVFNGHYLTYANDVYLRKASVEYLGSAPQP